MAKIYLITDYLDRFGTKYSALPYRSGMDKSLLESFFGARGFETEFITASEVLLKVDDPPGKIFLYTSLEDKDGYYKSYIEDLILALDSMGAVVVPLYKYLHAHNNKVFFEMLRKNWSKEIGDTLKSQTFGSLEDLNRQPTPAIGFPAVIKRAEGFKSRGVYLAENRMRLLQKVKKIARSQNLHGEFRDQVRRLIHKNFRPESLYRKKFLIQEFIPGLENDFKVLVFDRKFYVLCRKTRKNDFRASGSGLLSYPPDPPLEMLDFALRAFRTFNVPFASFDIAQNGKAFSILEAQFVFFGTYTIENSEFWFENTEGKWTLVKGRSILEEEYASSIISYLNNNRVVK